MNDVSGEVQSRELTIAKKIGGALQRMAPEFKAVLPAHIRPEAFIRVAQTAISVNESLQLCTPKSLIASCTRLAEMGLQADGVEAAIVAYDVNIKRTNPDTGLDEWRKEKQAKPMPMVAGIRDLVRRSGQVKDWKARIVRLGDYFKHVDGDVESLVHESAYDDEQPITHVYSIAYLENGELSRHVMTIAAVEKIRRRSRSAEKGPWVTDYEEMVKKTCLRQHSKALPKAKEDAPHARFMGAIRALDDAEDVLQLDRRSVPLVEAPALSSHQAAADRLARAVEVSAFEDDGGEDEAMRAAGEDSRELRQAPAEPATKTRRPRRTAAEKLAEVEAGRQARLEAAKQPEKPKQPPAASPAPQAQQETRQAENHPVSYDDGDRFPGDPDPEEFDGEDPAELAYRDGWHTASRGKTRLPPKTINNAQDAEFWFKGYDAYTKAVELGNKPATIEASEAMLDRMASQVFI